MLQEAHQLAALGRDVVVGIIDDHGRKDVQGLVTGLWSSGPGQGLPPGGPEPTWDVEAVVNRKPEIVVVDDIAHANSPGSRYAHRWQDVELLLASGIDVLSTASIQHLASLSDVVSSITGQPPGETIPDEIVRRADHIELVDIAPELLQERLLAGNIYPPDMVDAALANEFRLGNLSALREIALIWLADRVDEGLAKYRASEGITATWPARERVVVGLGDGAEGEALIRRAFRILSRINGGDLLAVHIARPGRHGAVESRTLADQRQLVRELGGTYHTLSGKDVAKTLLEFARSVNATQIVMGVPHGRLANRLLGGNLGYKVVSGSGDIDVHMVSRSSGGRTLPELPSGSLGRARTTAGFIMALLLPALITAVLTVVPDLNLATHVLIHLTGVVTVAFVGGLWPAVMAALLDSLLLNYFETEPVGTLGINNPQNVFALLVFLCAAVSVSLLVGISTKRTREAARAQAEAGTLADLARDALLTDDSVEAFLGKARETFQVQAAGLFTRPADANGVPWQLHAFSGSRPPSPDTAAPGTDAVELADPQTALVLSGRTLTAGDRRLLSAHGAHLLLLRQRDLLHTRLKSTSKLAEGNSIRTSILRAVGHDLRTPLAGIKLAVTALQRQKGRLPEALETEMLDTIDSYADRLDSLIARLLDMSRISSGSAAPLSAPVAWRDAIEDALRSLPSEGIRVELAPNMPVVEADIGMLERVIANIVENALKYAPGSDVVIVGASGAAGVAMVNGRPCGELRIVDHGRGVEDGGVVAMFQPFQRLDDAPEGSGIGLGLAVAKGFTEAMGGELIAQPTPGGGLTMVIRLPLSTGHGNSGPSKSAVGSAS